MKAYEWMTFDVIEDVKSMTVLFLVGTPAGFMLTKRILARSKSEYDDYV